MNLLGRGGENDIGSFDARRWCHLRRDWLNKKALEAEQRGGRKGGKGREGGRRITS
jgi:hypothetical protein